MALDIGNALRDGVGRLQGRSGLLLAAIFAGFGVVNAVVQQSLSRTQFEQLAASGALDRLLEGSPVSATEIEAAVVGSTPLAALDSLSVLSLLGLALILAVVAETLRIVAVRTFAGHDPGSIPEGAFRNLGWAVLNGIVGGIVVGILVAVGLVLLVVPGVFLAVSLFFVRQEIAIEDRNAVEAISESWSLTAGDRIEVFGLLVFLLVLGIAITFAVGLVTPTGSAAGATVDALANGVFLAYGVAVATRAYEQLRGDDEPAEDELEGVDPELLP
ncbi:MAG: hypothetical protein ABEH66_07225 [Halobacteriales archaeon]